MTDNFIKRSNLGLFRKNLNFFPKNAARQIKFLNFALYKIFEFFTYSNVKYKHSNLRTKILRYARLNKWVYLKYLLIYFIFYYSKLDYSKIFIIIFCNSIFIADFVPEI